MVETVGHVVPCFRHGTDYILNLCNQVPRRIIRNLFFTCFQVVFRILVLPFRQPMSRYTAVGLLHIPLGIALSLIGCLKLHLRLRFHRLSRVITFVLPQKATITNRTHVQKYRHLSFYERSQYISISPSLQPTDRRPCG